LDQHQLYKKWIFCNDGSACSSSALVTHCHRVSTSFPKDILQWWISLQFISFGDPSSQSIHFFSYVTGFRRFLCM
jgi:hypothetical protein